MPGQGYHYGLMRLAAKKAGKEVSREMTVGTLVMDALNTPAGSRRRSHFTGGAGCILPQYLELRNVSTIQSWDSAYRKSYLVDPEIDIALMEAVTKHIPESDYKDGIRIHLLGDRSYDKLVQHVIFDVSAQADNVISTRKNHRKMDGSTFRNEIYASYPMLDQYLMELAAVTAEEIDEVKRLLKSTLSDAQAEFIIKYLNFRPEVKWSDTEFFKKDEVDTLIDETVAEIIDYLEW